MMKKIFALVFILVLGKMSYSQNYPLTQQLGSDSTIVISKGALQSRLAPIVISDTTAANNQRIKNYPGAQLYTANGDFYVRNATATKWVLVSSGSSGPINIYNSDGTLTGNRVLTGAGNSLTFNGISGLGINKVADSVFTVEGGIHATGGLRLDNLVSSPGTKALRIDGQGVVSVADTSVGTVISIATNNGTGITGGTITSTGTLAIDTTIISTRAWRQKGIDSVAALPKVTSVGLTMPVAFNVSGSPITSAGTLSVTAAGVASQYIRGDGQLATLPTTGGGGSSVSYYLNGSVNQGTFGGNTYYQMNKTPVIGTGTDFTISSNGYIASFITDAGDPDLLNIPAGNWDFEIYFQSSSSSGTPSFYVELYKYNGTTFTLIASSSTNPKFITSGTTVDAYYTPLPVPATTLAITDRLAIRVYVNNSGNTITLHTEDNNLCQVITTFSTGINALNGLTDQVQYFAVGTSGTDFNISSLTDTHTFNLPTASATNRGALSSADWTTFNSKISPSDTASMLAPYLRKADTTAMLANYVNNVGYGLSKAGQVVSADSATLANYFLRRKDSLTSTNLLGYVTRTILADTAAAIRSADAGGTVTSIATNNGTGITGGTITTTGTLAIDTLLISTRAWRQKGVDSVAALVNSNVSGTTNRVSKFTGANTIGNSSIADSSSSVAMTILSSGNIGINTSAPNEKLETVGVSRITKTTSPSVYLNIGMENNTAEYDARGSIDQVWKTQALERMRLTLGGNLGVGTVSPDSMLTVNEGARFLRGVRMSGLPSAPGTRALRIDANGTLSVADTTTGGGGGIGGSGTTNRIAKFTASGTIGNSSIADSSSSVAMTISSGGNVGIGTTSPASPLSLSGSADVGMRIKAGSANLSFIDFDEADSGAPNGSIAYNHGTNAMTFATGGSNGEKMRITSGGNLGIGTTTIGSRLQVNGNAAIGYSASTAAPTNGLMVAGNVGVNVTPSAWASGFRAIQIGARSAVYNSDINFTGLGNNIFYDGSFYRYITTAAISTIELGAGVITFGNAPSGTAGAIVSGTERMRIDASGNLGIGTTTIGSRLQVNGNAAIGYSASTAAPTNGLQVAGSITGASNSNTFGTSSASGYPVIVNTGTGSNSIKINGRNNAPNDESGIEFFRFDGVTRVAFIQAATNFFAFATSSEAMRINSSNFLGIGTTTIGSRLQVNGGAAIGYSASTAAPTNGLAVAGNIALNSTLSGWISPFNVIEGNTYAGYVGFQTNAADMKVGINNFYDGTGTSGYKYKTTNGAVQLGLSAANGFQVNVVTSGTANTNFVWTQAMLINLSGEVKLTPAANTSVLSTTGAYSLTGSNAQSLIDLAGTWNTTGNPTAIKLNITNTASGASAYLMDLQVGAATQFRVTKAGAIRTAAPTSGTANDWKLGSVVGGTTVLDTTQWLEVEVGGTLYRVALVTLPEPEPGATPASTPEDRKISEHVKTSSQRIQELENEIQELRKMVNFLMPTSKNKK